MRSTFKVASAMILGGVGLLVLATAVDAQAPGTAKTKAPAPAPARPQPAPARARPQPAPAPAPAAAAEDPRERPIRDVLSAFTQAFNAGDSNALAGLFVDSASVIDPSGNETQGKAALGAMYAASLRESPGLKLESEAAQIRLLTPDLARVDGRSKVFAAAGSGSEFTEFSALMVRSDGKWRLAEIREHAAPLHDVTPYERLRELEWMVGDWVDEGEGNKVVVNIRWADNQSYLVRSYRVELSGENAHSGTMYIGWDPLTEQIKSWVFDSEGGHGEGFWTRTADKEWVVKASGVLHDGRPTSATHIHSILNKDSVKTNAIDRIIGGEIAPDILDVVMVRRPPPPESGAAQPGATGTRPAPGVNR